MLCSYPLKLKHGSIVKYITQVMTIPLFFTFAHIFKRNNWRVSWFDKNFVNCFFMDTVRARFFKLCIIITLLGVYQFIPDLMTMTFFQGNRCVKILDCKLFFLRFLYRRCMVLTYMKKIRDSVLCVSDVYLRDITSMILSTFLLNVSCQSFCSS